MQVIPTSTRSRGLDQESLVSGHSLDITQGDIAISATFTLTKELALRPEETLVEVSIEGSRAQ